MKHLQLNHNQIALIDDQDFDAASQYSWYADRGYAKHTFYVKNDRGVWVGKAVGLHAFIMNPPSDKIVDHINGNGLDNRRSNLRICTWAQNLCNKKIDKRNKTGFKGVYFEPEGAKNPYRAMIGYDHKLRYIGLYATAEDAARAYNDAARELHGEFARLNKV